MSEQRKIPAPQANPETKPFFDAARQGKLLVGTCKACGETHYYPRAHCPFCFSDKTEWVESKGEGTIYSFSIMRRAKPPYAIAYVALSEGVTMMTNIVDSDFESLKIGQNVRLKHVPTEGDGPPMAMFVVA
jgi:uncharacterized OB-fold protein